MIGVLCGGISREREISFRSGENVYQALRRLGHDAIKIDPATELDKIPTIDVAFNALHGKGGEDGTIQGFLETLHIPYTGSRVLASSLAMNKVMTKALMQTAGVPTSSFCQSLAELQTLRFPVVVKPLQEGSSFGVRIVKSADEMTSLENEYGPCFVEEYISGQEITVSILEDDNGPMPLPILELKPTHEFYDYDAKYTKGLTRFILPAQLSQATARLCQDYALRLHRLLGCRTMSRVDMIVHPDHGPFILEINTIPGLTDLSDLPAQANHAGLSFDNLIAFILKMAK